jgi:DNA-binding cell septation regulator SpoVG
MNITQVQIHTNKNPKSAVQAFADIILDEEFIIRNLVILKDSQDVHYVNMPNKTLRDGTTRQDIAHPIKEACRQYIETKVLDAYEEHLSESN